MTVRARKLMTMHRAINLRDDIDWLYVWRKEGRGHASIDENVDASIRRLEDNIKKIKEGLIMATRNSTDDDKDK